MAQQIAGPPESRDISGVAIVLEALLAAIALAAGWLLGVSPLGRFPLDSALVEHLRAVAWGLLATVPLVCLLLVIRRFPLVSGLRNLNRVVDEQLLPLFAETSVPALLAVSIAAGIGEELLFRGLILDGLAAWWQAPAAAVIVSSLLFGICHWLTHTYALLATLIGLLLAVLFLWTDHLLAAIVAHAAYDFVALLYLTRSSGRRRPTEASL